jgi:thiamine phosphate synthase YjbQ (UPF0047 family)
MSVLTKIITVSSNGENDMIDITHQTAEAIKESGLQDGIVAIFCIRINCINYNYRI